ncbi:MAG: GHKL domain-containing protein [Clostridia bacterium]|nr:GHKL domain-containing protein [Clostridia bacterium]
MVSETEYVNEVLPIYDTSISAMLYAYRSDAESSGIRMKFDITNNLKGLAPEAYEINRIIGNLLQNAIDAVSSEKDREYGIVVKIYESNGSSVIDISNKFFGDVSELSHMFEYNYSGKKNHEGLGLSTVQRIVESYKGVAYVEMDEDIIHFIVRLPKKYK